MKKSTGPSMFRLPAFRCPSRTACPYGLMLMLLVEYFYLLIKFINWWCACGWGVCGPQCCCRGQRTIRGSWFFPTLWVPGMELISWDLGEKPLPTELSCFIPLLLAFLFSPNSPSSNPHVTLWVFFYCNGHVIPRRQHFIVSPSSSPYGLSTTFSVMSPRPWKQLCKSCLGLNTQQSLFLSMLTNC